MNLNGRLIIIDSNSILHRSFHALPPLTTKSGEPINAVYGFLLILFKTIRDLQPDFICACFDFPAKTFRHQKFKGYKATRPPTPKDLTSQIPKLKEILKTLSIPYFEKEGFEADDLISTISNKAKQEVSEIYILSGDFDVLQLADQKIKIQILSRGIKKSLIFDQKKVLEKTGVIPKQIPDFKALTGDPSDNIPGIPGIGPKTAIRILAKCENLESVYREIEKLNLKEKIKRALIENKQRAFLSRELAKLRDDLEVNFDLKKCKFGNFDRKKVEEEFKKFEFSSLLKRIPEIIQRKTRNLFN